MKWFHEWCDKLHKDKLKRLRASLRRKQQEQTLKREVQKSSNSIFWVWEFSKKVVLICFLYYMIIQVYAMVVMAIYLDFTHLGELINKSAEILKDCVFMYLVKSGVENAGKIVFQRHEDSDEAVG